MCDALRLFRLMKNTNRFPRLFRFRVRFVTFWLCVMWGWLGHLLAHLHPSPSLQRSQTNNAYSTIWLLHKSVKKRSEFLANCAPLSRNHYQHPRAPQTYNNSNFTMYMCGGWEHKKAREHPEVCFRFFSRKIIAIYLHQTFTHSTQFSRQYNFQRLFCPIQSNE